MSLIISKVEVGQKLDLSKQATDAGAEGLTDVTIGLGWDENAQSQASGDKFDGDLVIVGVKADGKADMTECIYFHQRTNPSSSIQLSEDNQDGAGDGDDETADINLVSLPADVVRLDIYATVYDAKAKNQNFGKLSNSAVRVLNKTTGDELAKLELDFDSSNEVSVLFGSIHRRPGGWIFEAKGSGFPGEIAEIFASYDVATS